MPEPGHDSPSLL